LHNKNRQWLGHVYVIFILESAPHHWTVEGKFCEPYRRQTKVVTDLNVTHVTEGPYRWSRAFKSVILSDSIR